MCSHLHKERLCIQQSPYVDHINIMSLGCICVWQPMYCHLLVGCHRNCQDVPIRTKYTGIVIISVPSSKQFHQMAARYLRHFLSTSKFESMTYSSVDRTNMPDLEMTPSEFSVPSVDGIFWRKCTEHRNDPICVADSTFVK